jgi:hypothetical protein
MAQPKKSQPPADDGLYELNLPQDEQDAAAPPPPSKPSKSAPSGKPGASEPVSDTALPADFQPEPVAPTASSPSASTTSSGAPSGGGGGGGAGVSFGGPEKKTPKIYPEEPEPAYVDPHVAARKREEARIRAAEQLALEAAAARRRRLILFGIIAVIAAGVGLFIWYTRS